MRLLIKLFGDRRRERRRVIAELPQINLLEEEGEEYGRTTSRPASIFTCKREMKQRSNAKVGCVSFPTNDMDFYAVEQLRG